MDLRNNTILITGGGSGIGHGLAQAFHALGNQVIIAGRRRNVLDEVVAAHPGMRSLVLDVGDAESIRRGVAELTRECPALNAVINNAGVQCTEELTRGDTSEAEVTIATNLLGPIRLTAALLPMLMAQPRATVVNVTSGLAFVPQTSKPTYCATKAALHSFTQSLRVQLRHTSVRVLEIVPPYVQTGLQGNQRPDPKAMPLGAFVAEVMQLLKENPDAEEVLVDRVTGIRFAEARGSFEAVFKAFNGIAASGAGQ